MYVSNEQQIIRTTLITQIEQRKLARVPNFYHTHCLDEIYVDSFKADRKECPTNIRLADLFSRSDDGFRGNEKRVSMIKHAFSVSDNACSS